jgi:hypothetical protein
MLHGLLADAILLLHLGFILFVVCGGFLVWRCPRLAWLHLPAAAWGALIELGGWDCPLTPLENRLRQLGGGEAYAESFVAHYLMPLIYPAALTRELQIALGLGVVAINILAYALRSRTRRKRA